MGRPKMPKDSRKTVVVNIRVTPAQKRKMAKAARDAGATGTSDWLRILGLREADKNAPK